MTSTSRARICDLPDEVLLSIFSFLPVADLARCAATCEQWHHIVTGFTHLWKGKRYRTFRSPKDCSETRAILHALPPLQELIIDSTSGFVLSLSYPRLHMSVKYVNVLEYCPRLRCEFLAARLDIAGDIFSHRSTIDFERLRHLRIVQIWEHNWWYLHEYTADNVVWASLSLCPNLTRLSVRADFLSADYLDAVGGFAQLETFEMDCPGIEKLSFLRHCSDRLEGLQLTACICLPSQELAELLRLRNLRKLRLTDCRFEESDLGAALTGLHNLESLELNRCSPIRDLSVLRHCGQLRKFCITNSRMLYHLTIVAPAGQRLYERQLLSSAEVRSLRAIGIRLTADSLSAALTRLEHLGLNSSCIAYLDALHSCSQLRHLCCDFPCVTHTLNVRVHITITSSQLS